MFVFVFLNSCLEAFPSTTLRMQIGGISLPLANYFRPHLLPFHYLGVGVNNNDNLQGSKLHAENGKWAKYKQARSCQPFICGKTSHFLQRLTSLCAPKTSAFLLTSHKQARVFFLGETKPLSGAGKALRSQLWLSETRKFRTVNITTNYQILQSIKNWLGVVFMSNCCHGWENN